MTSQIDRRAAAACREPPRHHPEHVETPNSVGRCKHQSPRPLRSPWHRSPNPCATRWGTPGSCGEGPGPGAGHRPAHGPHRPHPGSPSWRPSATSTGGPVAGPPSTGSLHAAPVARRETCLDTARPTPHATSTAPTHRPVSRPPRSDRERASTLRTGECSEPVEAWERAC